MISDKAGYVNFNNVTTENQPFPGGTLGCNQFRIPGIIRLENGNLFAVTDARWDCAKTDYGGIDTMYSVSEDDGKTWKPSYAAYFPDSNTTPENPSDTTTCIDSCVVQDKTGRIHIIVNMNPTGITTGLKWPGKGSGFVNINGKEYISLVKDYSLTDTVPDEIPREKLFYLNEDREIVSAVSGKTEYSADGYFNLYKNGEALYQKQVDTNETVQQNLFYRDSEFHVYNTMFSLHLYSDDCKKWETEIISNQIKEDFESGLISSPGNGILTSDGKLLMPFYSAAPDGKAQSLIVYSDDNGKNWKRTPFVPVTEEITISTEGKITELTPDRWRLFFRNTLNRICYADFIPSENSWLKPQAVDVKVHSDCNFSAIMSGNKILVSYPVGRGENNSGRVNGRLFVFSLDEKFNMTLADEKLIEENSFSYSCLTTLSDGTPCVLFDTCDDGFVIFGKIGKTDLL